MFVEFGWEDFVRVYVFTIPIAMYLFVLTLCCVATDVMLVSITLLCSFPALTARIV